MSNLPSEVGFALFKPDLFYRKLLGPVLHFLKEKGVVPLSFLAARVSDAQYKKMYSSQFLWDLDDWYHNKQLYAFGPGLGVLFYHEKGCTQQLLSEIKGSALPQQRQEGSLRKTFFSKSRVFNLIHVPDHSIQAEKEALHWFGGSLCFNRVTSEEMKVELDCFEDIEKRLDPEEAFLNAKLRLLHVCKNYNDCPSGLKTSFLELSRFYRKWKDALSSRTEEQGIEGTLLSDFQQEEEMAFKQLLQKREWDQNRKQAMEVLREVSFTKYPSNFFWILDEWNVYLSELEKYLILCRLKYNFSKK